MNKMTFNHKDIVSAIVSLAHSTSFKGTMTELKDQLAAMQIATPTTASHLSHVFREVISKIRNKRVSVKFVRANDRKRTRLVVISPSKSKKQ